MANINTKAHVLVRDRFRCYYCGGSLFLSQGIKILDWMVDGLGLYDAHGKKEPLRSFWATVDHVMPENQGGMDTLDNLVACCVSCNSQMGDGERHAQCELVPGGRWDGLSGLFVHCGPQFKSRLSRDDLKWLAALQREKVQFCKASLLEVLNSIKECQPGYAGKINHIYELIIDGKRGI